MRDTHRRTLSTTLGLLDEMLCDFEQWAGGREIRSVLYREENTISGSQARAMQAEISAMRDILRALRDELQLDERVRNAKVDVWSRCSWFWENLAELDARHLRAYGEPSEEMVACLEPRRKELIDRLQRITDAVRGTKAVAHDP